MRALLLLRKAAALGLAWLIAASPAQAQLVLRPGPVAVGGAAAPAAPPSASVVLSWAGSLGSFLRSPAPDLAGVTGIATALAAYDQCDPAARAAFEPLAEAVRAELPRLLAAPAAGAASEADLRAAQLKLKVLNFPAVRALLPEEAGEAVAKAAWAYNGELWSRKGRGVARLAEGIAARLRETRPLSPAEAAPAPGAGPALQVEVLTGDIARVQADAILSAVDEAGLCRGGVNGVIERAGGRCFREQLERKGKLEDGQTLLARPEGKSRAAFDSVLFVSDERRRPLEQVVLGGLKAADEAGLASVSLPALRMGSVFGAVERSAQDIADGLKRGVELFLAEGRRALQRVSFVVYNDSGLAARLQAAFAGRPSQAERERSLRTDLRKAELSGRGYELSPKPAVVADRGSPVYASLLKPWDLSNLKVAHAPVPIGVIADRAAFSGPTPSVLNMPFKMPGTGFKVPEELAQFREFLQKIIDHEAAVNPELDLYYAYLTVDQNEVEAGTTQRRPGVHIDGVQGARYPVKLPPEHLYSASDALGTVFYDQSFDLSRLDPAKHHVHAELERQAKE